VSLAWLTGRRRTAVSIAALLVLSACAGSPGSTGERPSATPVASALPMTPSASAAPSVQAAHFEIPPPPGPVQPYRGSMSEDVLVVDGYASMLVRLKNVGQDPVTFLNTLYDYEPHDLYTPNVQIEWQSGAPAVGTRFGRFFPSPAVVPPGKEAVYLMAGQKVSGSGQIGSVVSHIKFCPTRGMDDVPADVLGVSGLTWSTSGGVTTVQGMLQETAGNSRATPPTIGVAFFDASGAFVGGVLATDVGARLGPNERRTFEISGSGVLADRIASATGWAWVS
jgi:hypothetical protein